MVRKIFVTIILIVTSLQIKAQDNTSILDYLKNFKLNAYVDAYYAYDTDKDNSLRQLSALSPYRDEFKVNIAMISLAYNSDKIRGIASFHFGDIPQVNWPSNEKYLQEANIGFSPFKNFWIDFGYFLTHIGAESALPKNNFLTLQSVGTYYEPFYQSGLRFSYEFSDKFSASLYLLNGYNVFADNNKNKSAGVQFIYSPLKNLSFSYNNLIGNEQPSSLPGKTRFYNNFVVSYSPSQKVDLLAGVDYCYQEQSKITSPSDGAGMISALISGRYKFTPKFSTGLRFETYNDPDGILSGTFTDSDGKLTGLGTFGITLGFEYKPVDQVYVRLEGRLLNNKSGQNIFYENKNHREELLLNMGFMY